ncbi:MAG: insulinase family protein [Magnetococcales bacterium]|nr:insulinase family protein [Magnetococcales bacterium]
MRQSRFVDGLVTILAGLLCTLPWVWLGEAWGLEAEDWRLDNGLRVILVHEAKAPVVVTEVWYRVGGIDERAGKTGLSHMLEHMMFRGTQEVPAGEYSRIIARHGGEDNASTSWDYTSYWSKLSSDHLDLALRLEADRMHNLIIDPGKFHSENLVVREERRTRYDSNPQGRFFEKFKTFFFQDHPYGRPVIGWMSDILGYTVKDLETWYRTWYTPDNAILVVVGDVDFNQAKKMIQTYFAPITSGTRKVAARLPEMQQVTGGRRLLEQDKGAMGPVLHLAWPAPSLTFGHPEDVYSMNVLTTILGGSGSSRLYRRVVMEQQLAVSVEAQFGGGYSLGLDTLEISSEPRDGIALAKLEMALLNDVDSLGNTLVADEELQRAKNGLLAEWIYSKDSVDHLAALIGHLSVNGLDWRQFVEHYPTRIQDVTATQIRDIARRYLAKDKAVIGILTP